MPQIAGQLAVNGGHQAVNAALKAKRASNESDLCGRVSHSVLAKGPRRNGAAAVVKFNADMEETVR